MKTPHHLISRRQISRLAAAAGFRCIGVDRDAAAFERDSADTLHRLYVTPSNIDLETNIAGDVATLFTTFRCNPQARAELAAALATIRAS